MWIRLDRLFRSPWLAITLMAVLGVASVFGSFPPDVWERTALGSRLAPAVRWLRLDAPFWTPWYAVLLVTLAASMGYTAVRRLPVVRRAMQFAPEEAVWDREGLMPTVTLSLAADARAGARTDLERMLRSRGYERRSTTLTPGRDTLLFDKGRTGIVGAPLAHLGLVFVVLGGAITRSFGSVADVMIGEGETYTIPHSQARVRLEKFSIIHHPGTREAEEYVSTFQVMEPGALETWQLLRVGQPLVLRGTTLFQMRYRPDLRHVQLGLYAPDTGVRLGGVRLALGERARIPGQDLFLTLDEVIPDLVVDADGQVSSREPFYYLNPAARVTLASTADPDTPLWTGWAYKDSRPTMHGDVGPVAVEVDRVSVRYFSGIKVVRDPGVLLAYGGYLLLILGTFVSSFLFRRFVRVELEEPEDTGPVTLRVAGFSLQHPRDFEYEWHGLVRHIRRIVGE